MKVIKEIIKIAELNQSKTKLEEIIAKKVDCEGMYWNEAEFICELNVIEGQLYDNSGNRLTNSGLIDDVYYCNQHTGYCEDDYHGTLYFKTNTDGLFVKVPFAC